MEMAYHLFCLFVMSPIQVLVSPFYLFCLHIYLYQLPICLSASLIPVEPLLTWLLMSVKDNKASGVVTPLIYIFFPPNAKGMSAALRNSSQVNCGAEL